MSCNIINDTDNNIDNNENIKVKRTRNRLTKKEQFVKEREEFINQLSNIIGIDEKKNSLFLNELEKNQKLKEFILSNDELIRKIFKAGNWGYYSNEEIKGKGNIVGLVRSIYTDSNYDITSKSKTNVFDNIKKQYTYLTFYKKIPSNF
jgi:hypothetical protein